MNGIIWSFFINGYFGGHLSGLIADIYLLMDVLVDI